MFFLFFGTRPGKTETRTLHNIACPYCGQTSTLTALRTPNYFHIFWLPLFKIGTSETMECSHCKKAYFKDEFTDEMRRELDRLK
ncbi:zinc ribbon domain-containing protein [Flavobacteriaceae bacterium F89]|uniref:Zinc ribbon domain-containing protein n=1 Tax=Cerina litoralis TaxID=2874477 RepID=A0AAE3EUU3_9FLAO|nr:zinc ribbon domain-containing protein [Cerina litoralis]MCG2460539.1 zinc ribbon domain-containing protein [Cerina litoralis]